MLPKQEEKRKIETYRVFIAGLDGLDHMTEADIRDLLEPFGTVEEVVLPKDSVTKKVKGYAVADFKNHREAKDAIKELNGFKFQ